MAAIRRERKEEWEAEQKDELCEESTFGGSITINKIRKSGLGNNVR